MEANNKTHIVLAVEEGGESRETWNKKIDFLLSVIGFAVDLANVWRFPFLCYKNGGGAFLIPYGLMLIFGGIPLFYMELALGQFYRTGAITCWGRVCPLFKGIGWAVVLIAFYTDFFYNVVIAWALHFFFASFTGNLPWEKCDNDWNTPLCFEGIMDPPEINISDTNSTLDALSNVTSSNKSLQRVSPAHEYFERGMLQLHKSGGIFAVGQINWQLMLCLLGVYLICYFSLWKGIHTSGKSREGPVHVQRGYRFRQSRKEGTDMDIHRVTVRLKFSIRARNEFRDSDITTLDKRLLEMDQNKKTLKDIIENILPKNCTEASKVVWFTALFPYVVLFILLIRGATLPGAGEGLKFYLRPNVTRLATSGVWIDAGTQVFFSLGPGFGVLLAFASYNKRNNNVYRDALITSMVNCCTSFFSGFVIFMILGYMADRAKVSIETVATEGPGLVFEAYPMAIATLPGSTFWAIIFFLMLLTLGLDSSFGGSEAIITALSDEFPILRKHREIFVAILFGVYFIIGLSFVSQGGAYVVTLMDKYAAGYSILFAVFFETLAVSWAYGVERFSSDIESMMGFRPGIYWRVTWKYLAPIFLLFIMIFGLVNYVPLEYDSYVYPWQANFIGWCIALSSILCIPGFAIYQFLRARGSISERFHYLLTPYLDDVANCEGVAFNDVRVNGEVVGVHV